MFYPNDINFLLFHPAPSALSFPKLLLALIYCRDDKKCVEVPFLSLITFNYFLRALIVATLLSILETYAFVYGS